MTQFAKCNTPEKWQWYAEMYAHRRVFLGTAPDVRTAPFDERGEWFDVRAVDEAERRLINKRAAMLSKRARGDDAVWEARDIQNNWARDRGYRDFEDYKAGERLDHIEACERLILSLPGPQSIPRAAGGKLDNPHDVARLLGVKAREYTADELRAGRIALGLERPEPTNTTESAA